ncbi:LuxR family transcriptional regulator [Marinobacter santoriniensis NKSG1]|uniref:LuxR family transcriptional regulator n=1 Tax=Marinobacter santoriniensis NKSG1 TaxID=1288826 RepID=M7D2D4_9GAMM|nr:helix-turn-helix transcriptional regulator [Marinobacter santoriniensis]EMP54903.1 LuxR family transcriptional regulator [Marinobacter santoriniensis NKSG1]
MSDNHNPLISTGTLLDQLYEAAIDPGRWQTFIGAVAKAVNAKSALIRLIDPVCTRATYTAAHNFDPSFLQAYTEHFIHIDPVLEALQQAPQNIIQTSQKVVDYTQLTRTEYFNDYMRPQDNHYLIGGLLTNGSGQLLFLGAQRSRREEPFSATDVALLQGLVPHLQRAVTMWSRLDSTNLNQQLSDAVLQRLGLGLVALDEHGRVSLTNTLAEQILYEDNGIALLNDRLRANRPAENGALNDMIGAALTPGAEGKAGNNQAIVVRGGASQPLYVMALRRDSVLTGDGGPFDGHPLLILLGELNRQPKLNGDFLRGLYGLTNAEARLAIALSQGQGLSDYCDLAKISKHTGRAQLKSIFQKMDVQSQGQLIAKIVQGPWLE